MITSFLNSLFGTSSERTVKKLRSRVMAINALEARYQAMRDDELRAQTLRFREQIENGASVDDLLNDAFAVVREAAKRTLGQRHYDVQLIGGMVLHQGQIAEMRTGEGKTLVATLAAYLNALPGKGVHVITVNDYLAARDSAWMGKVYNFLGLSVGCITGSLSPFDRKTAYAADITYGTNNEFGFDYLRDNMKYRLDDMAQRPFHFAIVDEVDSILIDEARTPLIISGPSETATDLYTKVDAVIPSLQAGDHYTVDEKTRSVTLTDEGTEQLEQSLRERGVLESGALYDAANMGLVHHANAALRAHTLFKRDVDYIVKDGKVVIIDEFTGRMMEGRRYSEGLHQALEAKERVPIQNENQTLASITFQNYFRMYPKLAGMTGTALTEANEFLEIYNLGVVDIPTHVPVKRLDRDDQIFKSMDEKLMAIATLIEECRTREQPVLVGTVSIEKSEMLAALLKRKNIPHQVLNARYHEQEAMIIAEAGRPGAVTIATNMAGRGTDIQLGGNLEARIRTEIDASLTDSAREAAIEAIRAEIDRDRERVRAAGGLYVIGTERHESRRIDNQLRGRSGRQGDPGASVFFISLQDDLMRIFSPEALQAVLSNKQIGLKDGEALTHPWLSKALEKAQARVEAQNFEIRKTLLKFDNVMNDQRKIVYEQRREIMAADEIAATARAMRSDVIEDLVVRFVPPKAYREHWDLPTLQSEVQRLFNLSLPILAWGEAEGADEQTLIDQIGNACENAMAAKVASTDPALFRMLEKGIILQALDQHWKDHLLSLDHLRQGINLRAYAQRDPLNEYKSEAFSLFETMLNNLRESATQQLAYVDVNITADTLDRLEEARKKQIQREQRLDPALARAAALENGPTIGKVATFPIRKQVIDPNDPATWASTPRNAPCPCQSGKKYKHCHGKIAGEM